MSENYSEDEVRKEIYGFLEDRAIFRNIDYDCPPRVSSWDDADTAKWLFVKGRGWKRVVTAQVRDGFL